MEQLLTDSSQKTNWKHIIVFYILACAIAWPFFWWRDVNPESWGSWQLSPIVKTWTYMWGPGIAVIIVTLLFKEVRTRIKSVTFLGTSAIKSLAFWFVPFLLLAIPGIENSWGMNPHLFPILAMGCLGFISIIGEDSGWSYFLKNEMINISPIKRSIIIGVLWELWHFTNRTANRTIISAVVSVTVMILFLIVLTYIMSKITDRTKSLITAVTIHMWINVLSENGSIPVYIVFGISLLFWTFLFMTWDRPFLMKKSIA